MKLIFTNLFVACALVSFCQAPVIEWQNSLGGTLDDAAHKIQQTADGGYIMAAGTNSNDKNVSGNHGANDAWIVKLNSSGFIKWQKCLGGSEGETASAIQQTSDGGYIVAGGTTSNDQDVSGNHGGGDMWVVKLNSRGDIKWQKCLGGTKDEHANDIQQTFDGGYIIAGYTSSGNRDVSGYHGIYDYWIVKLTGEGSIEWQKCLGGSSTDFAHSIQQTKDSGYIVAGTSDSGNGDVSGNHGAGDAWIVKLDKQGVMQWQKCLGGSNFESANNIEQTPDGGYIVAGATQSKDGDVTGLHFAGDFAYIDCWIVKLTSFGTIEWQKCLGGKYDDLAMSIQQTTGDGYVVAGYSKSSDGDLSGNNCDMYSNNYWIVRLNNHGEIKWQKCLGGTRDDYAYSIQLTKDSGFIIAGNSYSKDGDITNHHQSGRYTDCWIVKLKRIDSASTITSDFVGNNKREISVTEKHLSIKPNPSNDGRFIINLAETKNNIHITVTDVNGKIIYLKNLPSAQNIPINLYNKIKGIYYLQVSYDGGKEKAKLFIQ